MMCLRSTVALGSGPASTEPTLGSCPLAPFPKGNGADGSRGRHDDNDDDDDNNDGHSSMFLQGLETLGTRRMT